MDAEKLMQKLQGLIGELGPDAHDADTRPYASLAMDSLLGVVSTIRAGELAIAAGASKAAVDLMLREHMLGRMQREAELIVRLVWQPAAELEGKFLPAGSEVCVCGCSAPGEGVDGAPGR